VVAEKLVIIDAVASLYETKSLTPLIQKVAERIFMPPHRVKRAPPIRRRTNTLTCGANKMSIKIAAVDDPELITAPASKFGTSTMVIGIEAINQPDGSYAAFCENGGTPTRHDAVA
jgi:cyclase